MASAVVLGVAAAALPVSLTGAHLAPTAQAQGFSFDISFNSFHNELARYGDLTAAIAAQAQNYVATHTAEAAPANITDTINMLHT